jgi:hypothetical protein
MGYGIDTYKILKLNFLQWFVSIIVPQQSGKFLHENNIIHILEFYYLLSQSSRY